MTLVWTILTLILILGCFFLVVGIIDGNRFIKVTNNFVLPNLQKNIKFIMISDLHDKVYGKNNEKVIQMIKEEQPDFVVIAGDLITDHVKECFEPGIHLVQELSKLCPVYYGMGNHESKLRTTEGEFQDKYEELLAGTKSCTTMLQNDSVYIPSYNLELTGLELPMSYFARFKRLVLPLTEMEKLVGKKKTEHATILIAHNPEYFETYASWGADLVLSGHVHGGIMKLPILGGVIAPSFLLFPKYDGGVFKIDNSTMLLGRGLGSHSIPLRFFNPAELHVVNCLKQS